MLSILVQLMHISSENGRTLVLCCEGNAGFYEIGVMTTPVAAGYSVLGWNHPGFGGSSGAPFPDQERNAVDAVMQFAIHRLGFLPQDIIVMGSFFIIQFGFKQATVEDSCICH